MTSRITNPEFVELAYEDSILEDLIVYIQRNYISDTNEQAIKLLHCQYVFYNEAEVPEHSYLNVIQKMAHRRAELQARMSEFELTKRTNEPQAKEDRKVPNTQGSKNDSKAARRTRSKVSRAAS